MDLSSVKPCLDNLREQGIKDFRDYFQSNPQVVQHCMELVKIADVNQTAQELYEARNKEELVNGMGRTLLKQTYDIFGEALVALAEGDTQLTAETKTQTLKGNEKHISLTALIAPGYEDTWSRVLLSIADLTERKQAEEELELSEARLTEAQRIAHLGHWDWDIAHNRLIWSDEIYRIFGLNPQQFGATYEAFLDYVHPQDREFVTESVSDALYKRIPYNIDHRIVRPDGSERTVHERAEVTFSETGAPVRMLGTVQDVTETKRVESQLRALSERLSRTQEEERRKIGRELHDVVGQSMTVLKLMLYQARDCSPESIGPALKEVDTLVDEVAEKVRSLSHSLQPAMLEDYGLLEALLNHFEWLTSKMGLKVNFKHKGLNRRFPTNVETAAFRVIQEALSNVIRHARVKEVSVSIQATSDRLYLKVEDRGVGFKPATIPVDSIGLRGMQERAELIGGSLVIDSSPGAGTCVSGEFPH
jgi:PAS domain S-box-containing protein